MRITNLKTNHLDSPIGYTYGVPRISYVVEETCAKKQTAAQVQVALDAEFEHIVHDSGRSTQIDNMAYPLPITLEPGTRYYWRVRVWADNGEEAVSETAWFETPKGPQWKGCWITPELDPSIHPVLYKDKPPGKFRRSDRNPGPRTSCWLST